jgi:hypothetical protein
MFLFYQYPAVCFNNGSAVSMPIDNGNRNFAVLVGEK